MSTKNKKQNSWEYGGKVFDKTSSEYQIWMGIIKRCENPNSVGFKYWGGKGIKVCKRWRHSFFNFLSDVGPRPSPKHSIDRIDGDKDYCPSNVRWATRIEQNRNRSDTIKVDYNGKKWVLRALAEHLGIHADTLKNRLKYNRFRDLPIDRPAEGGSKILTLNGETHSQAVWARKLGISPTTLLDRLNDGWPLEEALTTKKTNRYEREKRKKKGKK